MRKDDENDNIERVKEILKIPTRNKATRFRQNSSIAKKKQIKFNESQESSMLENQTHDIYSNQSKSQLQQNSSQSSFELQDESTQNKQMQQKQTIEKVLSRLGLNNNQNPTKNQQLQFVFSNIIENCIGTVDTQENTQTYQDLYSQQYHEQLKKINQKGSIIVSELNDIEKILKMPNFGFHGLYKYIRLVMKKISLLCQAIVEHPIFEGFILLTIILNSVKMAFDDPLSTSSGNTAIEDIFIVLYTIQMAVKIIAFGFIFGKNSYLRDPWNVLDFIIVSTSLMPLVISINFSVKSLRAIRVLRPLKTITKVRSLKMIVRTLFYSFSLVMDSLYILFFVMIVFSIAGSQLFSGLLQNRCMDLSTGDLTDIMCSTGSTCDNGYVCAKGIQNPVLSVNSFDTFIWAMLTVFKTLTMQGWSDIMIDLQQAYSPFSFIYSVAIVFFCQYVLLNMTLAILKYKYSQVKGDTIEQDQEEISQYEPDFLKKLKIYQNLSKLTIQPPLTRYLSDAKSFVGSRHFYDDSKEVKNYHSYDLTLQRLEGLKNTTKKSTNFKNYQGKLDIQQLKTIGKTYEQKWDAKTLEFQSMDQDQNQTKIDKLKAETEQQIKQMPEQQDMQSQTDSDSQYDDDEDDSSSSDSETLNKSRKIVTDTLYEVQRKLGNSTRNSHIQQRKSFSKSNKILPDLPILKKVASQNQQVQQLDNMLKLIAQNPGSSLKNNKYTINLPQIDLQQIQVEKLYQRFNDLGEYRIKRVQKQNKLNNIQIRRQKPKIISQNIKKKQNILKQIIQQAELDLKQLQLVNQLSKKELKCRIKNSFILEQQRTSKFYDVTRVINSLKLKEIQKKEEEIIENTNNLVFHVVYRMTDPKSKDKNEKQKQNQAKDLHRQIFRRNLDNQLKGLKLPQIIKQTHVKKPKTATSLSIKSEANNTYLKLLQNHQMQEKIELREDRIMHIFFRKENHRQQILQKKEEQQQKLSLIEKYKKTKQEDIFQNQGRIFLQTPFQTIYDSLEELLLKINMRSQQYEIFMRGFFGFVNVIRKKTLLFVTRPLYDNFMLICVIGNTIILSMSGFVSTDKSPYSDINEVFTFIFVVDLVLKIFAYGIYFFGDIMNLFDSFVVGISLVELSFGSGGSNLSALRAVRILRAFRVLRITRLVRTLSYMRIVMSVVSSIITEFVYIFLLLALFIFIYTLLGMQIFGGQFLPQSVTGVRQNFDNFFNSFFSVFQVLTVQNWNDIQAVVLTSQTGTWSVVFLISWIFIGNWILLNLLQAILLDGFDSDSDIFTKHDDPTDIQMEDEFIYEEDDFTQSETQSISISSGFSKFRGKSTDASLFIFYPDSLIRTVAIKIASSKIFEYILVFVIGLSSLKLVIDTYIDAGSEFETIANTLDTIFNVIFIFQAVVKIIAQGFILGQQAYLKSNWSKLDFFIVVVAVIDMTLNIGLSILKLFRTLRPLRIISRNPDMKIIISSLGESMLGIFNVLIIIMCIFLMIGILGINLLGNKLNYCNPTSQLVHNNYGPFNVNQTTCQSQGGVWTAQLINFDNIANSFLSLYVFSTRQNWPFYALTFMDATQNGPVKDNNQLIFMIFCVVIIFVISYFFMDLLVGVLFMNFHAAEQKIRPKKLSDKQINWQNLQKIIIEEDPCFDLYLKPANKLSQFFYIIVHNKWFDIFVTCCIVGNIGVMIAATNDQSSSTTTNLSNLNFAFSIVFIIEATLKFLAYGKAYFLSGWNIFDFFVVLASILDIIMSYTGAKTQSSSAISILPQIARIFRVLRVTKLLRMFKRFKGLQKLIQTFIFSLPALAKGLSIVCLFFFIFSVLASFLFNKVTGDYSGTFDKYRNFARFHNSFQTLFIMTTGQNWYFFMYETIYDGYVTCKQDVSDCTQFYFLIFWIVFVFLSQKVFMQLFVLIVLDQFEANYINENNPLGIFALLEQDFRDRWIEMTNKYHSQKIQTKRLLDFLLILKQPLGLGKNELMIKYEQELKQNQKITQQQIQVSLNELDVKLKKNAAKLINKIPIIKNRMYLGYHETFYHFSKLSIAGQAVDAATTEQKVILDQLHKQSQEALQKLKPQGNLYYYQQEANQNSQTNETLNPIELILFCQMIVKSWHNYSLKYHQEKKQPKTKIQENSLYNSLNNSCASDIEEAQLERMENQKKFMPRKGLLERKDSQQFHRQPRMIPNVQDHYRSDRKKFKSRINKKKNSFLRPSMNERNSIMENQNISIRIHTQQSQN